MSARLQFWLQSKDAWWLNVLGNRVSDLRYWTWRAQGSKW